MSRRRWKTHHVSSRRSDAVRDAAGRYYARPESVTQLPRCDTLLLLAAERETSRAGTTRRFESHRDAQTATTADLWALVWTVLLIT